MVGGVVGGVAVIIAVILYLIWIRPAWRKRQQRRKDVERTAANPGTTANPSTAHPNGEKLYNASIRSDPTFIQDGQTVVSEPVGVSKWLGELPPATPETGEGELGESPSSQRPASISALTGTTAMH